MAEVLEHRGTRDESRAESAPGASRAPCPASRVRWLRGGFFVLLALVTGLRAWFATSLALSGDEAYHWEWSRHLAPAYWDHPGITALMIRLAALVSPSTSELSVRLPAVLCLTATSAVAHAFARSIALRDGRTGIAAERAGVLAGLLLLFVPVYAVLAVYMSTDPPLMLFAASAWYLLYLALESDPSERRIWPWIGAGVALGLAASTKFLAFLIVPAVGLAMLVHAPYRRWLRRPQPYMALASGFAVFSPVLSWNHRNGWATFRFNFVERHDLELSARHVLEFAAGQAVILFPWILIAALVALSRAWRSWRGSSEGAACLLGTGTLLPIGCFLAVSCVREVSMHWTAAFWIPALIYTASSWSRKRRLGPWVRGSLGTTIALSLLLHAVAHVPASWTTLDVRYPGAHGRIKLTRFDERFGWPELGRRLAAVRREMSPDGSRPPFLFGPQYGVVSSASFYTPGQPHVFLWSERGKHGESFRSWDDFAALAGRDGCFFTKHEESLSGELSGLEEHFARLGPVEELRIERAGRLVRTFHLVRCYGFDGRPPQPPPNRSP